MFKSVNIKNSDILTQNDLFDPIINLKFYRHKMKKIITDGNIRWVYAGDEEAVYTLRSDYELEIEGSKYKIKKSTYKPSISVKLIQPATEVGINIVITIDAMHFFANGGSSVDSYTFNDNPITSIDLQMGYFNQFPDLTNSKYDKTDFFNFTETTNVFGEGNLPILSCQVLKSSIKKAPPDGQIEFTCIVGTFDTPLKVNRNESFSVNKSSDSEDGTPMERFCKWLITKQFVKDPHTNINELAKDSYGLLEDTIANKYGVQIYMSDIVKSFELGAKVPNEDGELVDASETTYLYLECASSVQATLANIRNKLYPSLEFVQLLNGDWFLYDSRETFDFSANVATLSKTIAEDASIKTTTAVTLPAIYDISYGGLNTINCPYFTFLQPFQKIRFNSRYNYANMAGYFTKSTNNEVIFYMTTFEVRFSTQGENNMKITCVKDSKNES